MIRYSHDIGVWLRVGRVSSRLRGAGVECSCNVRGEGGAQGLRVRVRAPDRYAASPSRAAGRPAILRRAYVFRHRCLFFIASINQARSIRTSAGIHFTRNVPVRITIYLTD